MPRDIGVTQSRLTIPQVRAVSPSRGGELIANALGNFADQVGGQIAQQAERNYRLRLDSEIDSQINRIASDNSSNPDAMRQSFEEYHDSLVESVPISSMETEVSHRFRAKAAPALNKAFEFKRKQLDAETEEQAIMALDSTNNNILNAAPLLFVDGDSVSDSKSKLALSILNREGGFVNDPQDRGGPTNFGITQSTLSSIRGKKVTEDDVKRLSKGEAAKIMVSEFYEKPGIDELPEVIRGQMFDMAVNHGPANAIKILQDSLGVKKTGKINAETKSALSEADPNTLKEARVEFYKSIVKNDPSQEKFLQGWLNRAEDAAGAPSPLEGNEQAIIAAQSIQDEFRALQNVLDATLSDGTPVFTPKQRMAKLNATRDSMFEVAAKTWLESQPNKIAAYQKWKDGEVKIAFPGSNGQMEQFNIREALPATSKIKIDKEFIRTIKDELSIQKTLEARQEKLFEQKSDAIRAEVMVRLQKGEDMLGTVEALRHDIEPDTYVDLRKMAIENEPLNNDGVYGDLLRRAYEGEDVSEEAKYARFSSKSIDNGSYVELIRISKGQSAGLEDAVTTGRKYIIENLGGLSKELPVTGSRIIANAKRDYDESISRFRQENQRLPSQAEAFDLADKIIPRWQALNMNEMAATLPKPQFMDVKEKVSARKKLTPEKLKDIRDKTDKYFLSRHGGDIDAVSADSDYQREMEYIDNFESIINNK